MNGPKSMSGAYLKTYRLGLMIKISSMKRVTYGLSRSSLAVSPDRYASLRRFPQYEAGWICMITKLVV
jgi:hypothetical protein